MEIATPYSDLFRNPYDRQAILNASDLVEIRCSSQAGVLGKREIFHCESSLLAPWDESMVSPLRETAEKGRIEAASFHLLSRYSTNKIVAGAFQGLGKPMSEQEMRENALHNIDQARKALGDDLCLLLENNNHLGTDAYDLVTEPAFITELIDRTGANLLLDVAHAKITAHNTKRTIREYMNQLPLEKCVQVHLSCHSVVEGLAIDAHDALDEKDWNYFESLLADSLPNVRYATIEYYKHSHPLLDMLSRLREVLDRHATGR